MTASITARTKNGRARDTDGPDGQIARILVAQDDLESRQEIVRWLEGVGYDVQVCDDSKQAVDMVHIVEPALLVLDFSKPPADTVDVCRLLRQETTSPLASRLPIIVFRSQPDEIDETVCLEVGADDYIGKPVHRRRFITRLRALLRRAAFARAGDVPDRQYVTSGDLTLDLMARRATRNGELLPLKPIEFDLLAIFVTHRGQILTRNEILARIWRESPNAENSSLNVHVHWLREKIEADPARPTRLQTQYGRGYVFIG